MSKLSEYLALIPKGLANPKQIVEGLLNNIRLNNGDLPEHEQEEILRRRLICMACPEMSYNKIAAGELVTKRKEAFCVLCTCPIAGKTASLRSPCGAVYYNENHEDKKEVKWEVYDNEYREDEADQDID